MGGDSGLRVSLPAAVHVARKFPDLELILVGPQTLIKQQLNQLLVGPNNDALENINVVHAPDEVAMSDKPSIALRHKQDSSMRVAIDLLGKHEVDAVVSAGNTGALMAIGCYVLKMLPGIDRPAICSEIPSGASHLHLLDLGANVDSKAEHLLQFAIMGSALSSVVDGIEKPRIALLNIGSEDIKGNEQVKLAGKLIAANTQLNSVGYVEGNQLFDNRADVVVCDGFVGNVALKACEGTADYISQALMSEFKRNFLSRIMAYIAMPVLKRVHKKLDPQQYNGASFLGLQGVVVKSHGSSGIDGFARAIEQAKKEVESNILTIIKQRVSLLVDR
jgi:glycerol-3-phosphate acyltransferase PlsX